MSLSDARALERRPGAPTRPAPPGQAGPGSRCPGAAPGARPAPQPRPAASPACGAVVNKGVRLHSPARPPGPARGGAPRSLFELQQQQVVKGTGAGAFSHLNLKTKRGKKYQNPNQLENFTRGQSSSASGYPQHDPGIDLGIWIC